MRYYAQDMPLPAAPEAIDISPQNSNQESVPTPAGDPALGFVEELFKLPQGMNATPLEKGLVADAQVAQDAFSHLDRALSLQDDQQALPKPYRLLVAQVQQRLGSLTKESPARKKVIEAKKDALLEEKGTDGQVITSPEQLAKTTHVVELLVTKLLPTITPEDFTPPQGITDEQTKAYLQHAHQMAFYTSHLEAAFTALEAYATQLQIDPSRLTEAVVTKISEEIGFPLAEDEHNDTTSLKEHLVAEIKRRNEIIQLRPENALVLQAVIAAQNEMLADLQKQNSLIQHVQALFEDGQSRKASLDKVLQQGWSYILARNVSKDLTPPVLDQDLSKEGSIYQNAAPPEALLQFVVGAIRVGYALDSDPMLQPLSEASNATPSQNPNIARVDELLQRVEALVERAITTPDHYKDHVQDIQALVDSFPDAPKTDTKDESSDPLHQLQTYLQQARSALQIQERTLRVIQEAEKYAPLEHLPPSNFPVDSLISTLDQTPYHRWMFWLWNKAVGQDNIPDLPNVHITKGVNVPRALAGLQAAKDKFMEQTQKGAYKSIEITGGDDPIARFMYYTGEEISIPLKVSPEQQTATLHRAPTAQT